MLLVLIGLSGTLSCRNGTGGADGAIGLDALMGGDDDENVPIFPAQVAAAAGAAGPGPAAAAAAAAEVDEDDEQRRFDDVWRPCSGRASE
jgi:hypothetical protein